jgi:hypothetical protein
VALPPDPVLAELREWLAIARDYELEFDTT